jgi:hypothetical protein
MAREKTYMDPFPTGKKLTLFLTLLSVWVRGRARSREQYLNDYARAIDPAHKLLPVGHIWPSDDEESLHAIIRCIQAHK